MNYYNIEIKSEKLTAAVAAELLNKMGEHNLIENFSYHHSREHQGGQLSSYTRGLPNIVSILEKYGITEDEMKWEDEFESAWTAIFEQYFADLPITREYHSILKKNVNEKTIPAQNGRKMAKLYFQCLSFPKHLHFIVVK